VSESAASAKRSWFMFGAKPAQSVTLVRAAAKRRPPERGRSGRKTRSYLNRLQNGTRGGSRNGLGIFKRTEWIFGTILIR